MITLTDAEKTFEKNSMSFQVDLKKCGTEGVYFNIRQRMANLQPTFY